MLNLSLTYVFVVDFTTEGIRFDPILRLEEKEISYCLKIGNSVYNVVIQKPEGFYRVKDNHFNMFLDDNKVEDNFVPVFNEGRSHKVFIRF